MTFFAKLSTNSFCYFLSLSLCTISLFSCSSSKYLESFVHESPLYVEAKFNNNLDSTEVKMMRSGLAAAINHWNLEERTFAVVQADSSKKYANHLILSIDTITIPNGAMIASATLINTALIVSSALLYASNENPASLLLAFISLSNRNTTKIDYQLTMNSINFEESKSSYLGSKVSALRNKSRERTFHLRKFNSQLLDFFESIEKNTVKHQKRLTRKNESAVTP